MERYSLIVMTGETAPGEDHVSLLRREMLRLGVVANAR